MKGKTAVTIATAAIIFAIIGYLITEAFLPSNYDSFRSQVRVPSPQELHMYLTMRAILATVNAGLLIVLLTTYIDVYRKTHAEFSIGLIIFATTLLLYAIVSGPLLFMLSINLRIFILGGLAAMLDLFTTAAVAILLYLSLK